MMRMLCMVVALLMLMSCKNEPQATNPTTTHSKSALVAKKSTSGKTPQKLPVKSRYATKKDAAPAKMPMHFKEPKPVKESLSRYGNPATYHTNGRSYEIMRSSAGYKARGVASWYGTKFHKQRTSSGDLYDMYAMTAAHKTLPLPSYVRVKNLDNGRTAVVKINDRGPFHGDRVIDLSYAAAVKLGLLPKGTANVEIEVIKGIEKKSRYYLQVGAFVSEHLARKLQEKIVATTTSPVFIERYNGHYIVRVGPFANKKMTDTLKMKLTSKGIYGAFSVLG